MPPVVLTAAYPASRSAVQAAARAWQPLRGGQEDCKDCQELQAGPVAVRSCHITVNSQKQPSLVEAPVAVVLKPAKFQPAGQAVQLALLPPGLYVPAVHFCTAADSGLQTSVSCSPVAAGAGSDVPLLVCVLPVPEKRRTPSHIPAGGRRLLSYSSHQCLHCRWRVWRSSWPALMHLARPCKR